MPAVSKQQRKFMGLVHAVQKGKVPASKVSKSAKDDQNIRSINLVIKVS